MRDGLMVAPWSRALLLPETEVEWGEEVFRNLSKDLHAKLGLPAWKQEETTRNLRRIFEFSVADGKSFDDSLDAVNRIFREILSVNGKLE